MYGLEITNEAEMEAMVVMSTMHDSTSTIICILLYTNGTITTNYNEAIGNNVSAMPNTCRKNVLELMA